jgi:hypothetical protein
LANRDIGRDSLHQLLEARDDRLAVKPIGETLLYQANRVDSEQDGDIASVPRREVGVAEGADVARERLSLVELQ